MKRRVFALWQKFRTAVMNPAAPDVQVKEMRRSFYFALNRLAAELASKMSPGDRLDNPSDEQVMRDVNQELLDFANEVKAGRA